MVSVLTEPMVVYIHDEDIKRQLLMSQLPPNVLVLGTSGLTLFSDLYEATEDDILRSEGYRQFLIHERIHR